MSWQSTAEAVGVLAAVATSAGAVLVAMRANGRADRAIVEARRSAEAAETSAAASEAVARIEADRHHREIAPVFDLVHIETSPDAWSELVRLECAGPLVYEVDVVQLLDYDEGSLIDWIGLPGEDVSARRLQDIGAMSAGDRFMIRAHRSVQLQGGEMRLLVSCSLDDQHWHELVECEIPGLGEPWTVPGRLMA